MSKKELITLLADKLNITKVAAEEYLNTLTDILTTEMKAGNKVTISGFGVFEGVDREAKTARNPQTGEMVKVPAKRVPKFKALSKLKEEVNS